jgi:hypothetical protein
MDESPELSSWLGLVRGVPGVVFSEIESGRIIAGVYTEEDLAAARAAARGLHIPDQALDIKLVRVWLDPYPNDPVRSESAFAEQLRKWEKEDRRSDG